MVNLANSHPYPVSHKQQNSKSQNGPADNFAAFVVTKLYPIFTKQQTGNHDRNSSDNHQPKQLIAAVFKIRNKKGLQRSFDHVPNCLPKINNNGKNRPQMHRNVQSDSLIFKSRKLGKQNQMPGRTHRQKLGYALQNRQK